MLIVLDFDGNITGTCQIKDHENKIVCTSMTVNVERDITFPEGSNQRQLGTPKLANISFEKNADIASPDLFRQACVGTGELSKATILFIEQANDPRVVEEWELTDPVVASFMQNISGDDHPTDSFTVNFIEIHVKYHGQDGKGDTAETEAGYNLQTREPA